MDVYEPQHLTAQVALKIQACTNTNLAASWEDMALPCMCACACACGWGGGDDHLKAGRMSLAGPGEGACSLGVVHILEPGLA